MGVGQERDLYVIYTSLQRMFKKVHKVYKLDRGRLRCLKVQARAGSSRPNRVRVARLEVAWAEQGGREV